MFPYVFAGRRVCAVVLLAALSMLAGCLSFRRVSAAAGVGQLVGARAVSVTIMPLYCDAENVLAGTGQTCPRDKVVTYVEEIVQYSKGIGRYAASLGALADYNDAYAGDALRQLAYSAERLDGNVLPPFDSTSVQLQTGAQSLGALLSQEWRRRKLTQLVIAAHPHVVALCDGLLARVTLLSEPVKSLAEQGLRFRRRALESLDTAPPTDNDDVLDRRQRQVLRLALLQFEFLTKTGYDNILNYKKALVAFKQAHTLLYDSVTAKKTLQDQDQAIYDLLKRDLPPLLH